MADGLIRLSESPRAAAPGSYSYSVTGGYSQAANCPIFDVSWGDAARFCNWLQNGQPDRWPREATGTTETGAYTLNGEYNAALYGNPQRRSHVFHSVGE